MRLIGIDPGLQKTGWGVIEAEGSALRFIACGFIKTNPADDIALRLNTIDTEITKTVTSFEPDTGAIEEIYVNCNPPSALKLGMARGVAMNAASRCGISVHEYAARLVKKAIAGTGRADKGQVAMMVRCLLPQAKFQSSDEADALAIAICHAHNFKTRNTIQKQLAG